METHAQAAHRVMIEALRRMTPSERYRQAMEMSDWGRRMLRRTLRELHPEMSEAELQKLYLERMARCYNTNY